MKTPDQKASECVAAFKPLADAAGRMVPASDIGGTGYGSSHNWAYGGGGRGDSSYRCRGCGHQFVHLYDRIPDIFKAMKSEGVPEFCDAYVAPTSSPDLGGASGARDGGGR